MRNTGATAAYDVYYFTEAMSVAEQITRTIQKDDIEKKLESLEKLKDLPKIPNDEESKQLKIYKDAKEVYKKLHIAVARAIMSILESNYYGSHDKADSYNYSPADEPTIAVEAIKLLPNAFVGGPIKSAIAGNNPYVQKIAIDYFESLPSDIRISDIFPKDFNSTIKKMKPLVLKRLQDLDK